MRFQISSVECGRCLRCLINKPKSSIVMAYRYKRLWLVVSSARKLQKSTNPHSEAPQRSLYSYVFWGDPASSRSSERPVPTAINPNPLEFISFQNLPNKAVIDWSVQTLIWKQTLNDGTRTRKQTLGSFLKSTLKDMLHIMKRWVLFDFYELLFIINIHYHKL